MAEARQPRPGAGRRVLVSGAGGRIARATIPVLKAQGWEVAALSHTALDITDRVAVEDAVASVRPGAILNLAAWTDADACEGDPAAALRINGRAVGHLRDAAEAVGAHLCHVSTDYVFDGAKRVPYLEGDAVAPLSAYGRSKAEGEREAGPEAAVVRVAWVACRHGRSLVRSVLDASADPGRSLRYVTDQIGSPSSGVDVAHALAHLLAVRAVGTFHAANGGQASPYDVACRILTAAGRDPRQVEPVRSDQLGPERTAVRPAYSVLDSGRLARSGGPGMASWTEGVDRLVAELLEPGARR